jgi:hypothetical protein
LSGLKLSFMCDASLSFFLVGPPVYVCATLLWGQEGQVDCRVTGCWVCSPGTLSLASSSSEALDNNEQLDSVTTGCLTVWLRLWHPWHTFRTSLNWTDVAWHACFVTISVKNQFRYFTGPQQSWPLVWSTHYATSHTDYELLTGQNNKLSMQHCGCKLNLKPEKCNAVRALNGVLQTNKMADKGLFSAACHHIIAVTLVPSSYTLQTK